MKKLVIGLIVLYRWLISPFLPPSCRFVPTCSRYAVSAIECHGLAKGLWMAIKRICRCHPFSKRPEDGFDPVPGAAFIVTADSAPSKIPANGTQLKQIKRAYRA